MKNKEIQISIADTPQKRNLYFSLLFFHFSL